MFYYSEMKSTNPKDAWNESFRQLREKARALLKVWDADKHLTHKDSNVAELLEELKLLHIELDLQNDELLVGRTALEDARDRYYRFYDQAPVAYLTISSKGKLISCNDLGARLLGLTRETVQKKTPLLTSFAASKKEEAKLRLGIKKFFQDRKPVSLIVPLRWVSERLLEFQFLPEQEWVPSDHVLVLARDVTEELANLVAAGLFSQAFLSFTRKKGSPVLIVDQNGKILFSSDSKVSSSLNECLNAKDWKQFKEEVKGISSGTKVRGGWRSKSGFVHMMALDPGHYASTPLLLFHL